ncbi:MAG: NnrS family protein [Shimia sp.]|uniref:NnrS family protein n=1 Tax=Shimia sp. TaxID=1954381 RepID=UPI003B8C03DD
MSCGPTAQRRTLPSGLWATLSDEGFRLFFPVAALYAAFYPLLWVLALSFDAPFAKTVPPSLWHAHEMIVGAFGAALIGFITTAAPEWTDTEPPRGASLWHLLALWGVGRVVGFLGWEDVGLIGALADVLWLAGLVSWLVHLSLSRKTDRLLPFVFWLALLAICTAAGRFGFQIDSFELASKGIYLAGFAFLGLLGLALSRITVPVTNLVLDPTEETSPFRPHPGRLHLAPGLVFVAMLGEAAGLSDGVSGFLWCAAGAAFMDRVAEGFVGHEALREEILMLAGSSALAGVGLILFGAARLGAFWSEVSGMHVAFMGGLGLGTYAVFAVAGLLHTDQPLGLSIKTRVGALSLVVAVALRVAPDLGVDLPGPMYAVASLLWAAGFLLWLAEYWPAISGRSERVEDVPA